MNVNYLPKTSKMPTKEQIKNKISDIKNLPYLLFAPILDPICIVLIGAACVWSWAVVNYGWHESNTKDISVPFGIITATIGFILPLQMSSALDKNKEGINLFNSFSGDVMALAWQLKVVTQKDAQEATETDEEKKMERLKKNQTKMQQLMHIFIAFPTAVKWRFRKGFKPEKIQLKKVDRESQRTVDRESQRTINPMFPKKNDRIQAIDQSSDNEKFINTFIGNKINDIYKKNGLSFQDAMFYKMFDLLAELDIHDEQKVMLFHTAERVYSSYGNMDNMKGYNTPALFDAFLFTAGVIYIGLIPFSFDPDLGFDIIWQVAIVIYFFLGIFVVTKNVANPFVSSEKSRGTYQTVGDTETSMNKALNFIAKNKLEQSAFQNFNWL